MRLLISKGDQNQQPEVQVFIIRIEISVLTLGHAHACMAHPSRNFPSHPSLLDLSPLPIIWQIP